MSTIKKPFTEIVKFLEANKDKKVSEIQSELLDFCKSQKAQETVRYDEKHNVTHVFCYYHKEWEDITVHAYGAKISTNSGLNTMCKEGTNQWTARNKAKKTAIETMFAKLSTDETYTKEQLSEDKKKIDADSVKIIPSKYASKPDKPEVYTPQANK